MDLDRTTIGRGELTQFYTDVKEIFADMLTFDDSFSTTALDNLISRWLKTKSAQSGFPLRPFPERKKAAKASNLHRDTVPVIPVPAVGKEPSQIDQGARVAVLGKGSVLSAVFRTPALKSALIDNNSKVMTAEAVIIRGCGIETMLVEEFRLKLQT